MFFSIKRWREWLAIAATTTAIGMMAAAPMAADFCFRDTYGRGVGKVPTACADANRAMDEGLCYKKCPPGYDGKATNCVKECPAGFRDIGLLCARPATYGVGVGQVSEALCNKADTGCHKVAGLWYPKCKAGYHNVGALLCEPDCPAGTFSDLGGCSKGVIERGVGAIPNACPSGQQLDAGLCYDNCKANFGGVGPVCWQSCPANLPHSCGVVGCAQNASECTQAGLDAYQSVDKLLSRAFTEARLLVEDDAKTFIAALKPTLKLDDLSAIGEVKLRDLLSRQAILASVNFTKDEIDNLISALKGRTYDPNKIVPKRVASVVKAYKRPQCG